MNRFVAQIISENPAIRDTPSLEVAMSMPTAELLVELAGLEAFRKNCLNLYHRVRAAIILHGVCRFRLQEDRTLCGEGLLDKDAFFALFERQFESHRPNSHRAKFDPGGGELVGPSLRTGRVSGSGGSGPPIREATGRQSLDVSLGRGGGASASYYSRTVGAGPGDRSFSPLV